MVCISGTRGLRDVRINVPSAVVRGDDAILECYYDLEGDQLYAVKWYLGITEFYRYTPKEIPPIKQFPTQNGLTVRESASNATCVVLEHVPRSISGRYSCEVSADAPSFFTSMQTAYLQVVDLPPNDPYISGMKTRYHHGEILKANCTSEHSNPAANLTWYINGMPAEQNHVRNFRQKSADGQHYTAVSMLRMRITKQSFLRHRLKIRCVANMYGIYYKSHEKSVEPEKKRHHHYVATTTNPLLQWELTEDSESVPKVRFVYNSSTGGSTVSTPAASIVLTVTSLLLLR
jgi:hypothetical protein